MRHAQLERTQVDPIIDPELSLRAKGAAAVIRALGPDAATSIEMIAAHSREGIEATRSAIRELKRRNYLEVELIRGDGGRISNARYSIVTPRKRLAATPRKGRAASRRNSMGWTYAVSAPDRLHVKIGTSENPQRRLHSHNTSSPVPLSIIWMEEGGMALEYFLHGHFADRRIRGEWFDFTGLDALEEIVAAAAQFGRAS